MGLSRIRLDGRVARGCGFGGGVIGLDGWRRGIGRLSRCSRGFSGCFRRPSAREWSSGGLGGCRWCIQRTLCLIRDTTRGFAGSLSTGGCLTRLLRFPCLRMTFRRGRSGFRLLRLSRIGMRLTCWGKSSRGVISTGRSSRASGGSSRITRGAGTSTPRGRHFSRSSGLSSTGPVRTRRFPTLITAFSTTTRSGIARSGRSSSFRRPGGPTRRTATATARPTPAISSTPRSRRLAISAPAGSTWPIRTSCGLRSIATTTPTPTSPRSFSGRRPIGRASRRCRTVRFRSGHLGRRRPVPCRRLIRGMDRDRLGRRGRRCRRFLRAVRR